MDSNVCYSILLIFTAFYSVYSRVKLNITNVKLCQFSIFLVSSSVRQVIFVFIDSSAGVELFIYLDLFIFSSGEKSCF